MKFEIEYNKLRDIHALLELYTVSFFIQIAFCDEEIVLEECMNNSINLFCKFLPLILAIINWKMIYRYNCDFLFVILFLTLGFLTVLKSFLLNFVLIITGRLFYDIVIYYGFNITCMLIFFAKISFEIELNGIKIENLYLNPNCIFIIDFLMKIIIGIVFKLGFENNMYEQFLKVILVQTAFTRICLCGIYFNRLVNYNEILNACNLGLNFYANRDKKCYYVKSEFLNNILMIGRNLWLFVFLLSLVSFNYELNYPIWFILYFSWLFINILYIRIKEKVSFEIDDRLIVKNSRGQFVRVNNENESPPPDYSEIVNV